MNFLGIGPWELVLIFIIALIVFGPNKLPEMARKLGEAIRTFQKMSTDFQVQLQKELQELDDLKSAAQEAQEGLEALRQLGNIPEALGRQVGAALVEGQPEEAAAPPDQAEESLAEKLESALALSTGSVPLSPPEKTKEAEEIKEAVPSDTSPEAREG